MMTSHEYQMKKPKCAGKICTAKTLMEMIYYNKIAL